MPDVKNFVDFVVQAKAGREFRILQITDTQIIDPGQSRYPERINNMMPLSNEQLYADCFYYIEKAVETAKPDLILMTGDNVYGEFDDSGASLKKLIAFMEGFQIPWAPVFGNHDNESTKGVAWQCRQYEEAEHCLFKRGEVTGNSNYTIGIEQGGKLIKVIYMMDSNGCSNGKSFSYWPEFGTYNQEEKMRTDYGFGEDQLKWLVDSCNQIGEEASKFVAFHVPIWEYWDAAIAKGYPVGDGSAKFVIDDPSGVDFGAKYENFGMIAAPGFWELLKKHNFDGVFVGHCHINSLSMLYDGIRLTYGLKTSRFDYHREDMLGGTLVTIAEGGADFQVRHIYTKKLAAE